MKRLMYCPIYRDELEEVFNRGILPESNGFIDLFNYKRDAEFCFHLNHPEAEDGCILKVLADESMMNAFSTYYCGQILTVYEFRGRLSPDCIALNENDVDYF